MAFSLQAHGSINETMKIYNQGGTSSGNLKKIIISLVKNGYYYSAIPLMKEYLVMNQRSLDSQLDSSLEKIIDHAGVKPFETLPENVLNNSKSSNILYILAKRKFLNGDHEEAYRIANRISNESSIYPYSSHLKGAALTLEAKYEEAFFEYTTCIKSSLREKGRAQDVTRIEQLKINADSCKAGIARNSYAQKKYDKADLQFLDIEKDSMVWPEILFEEAWNSYYQKNYNRSLGKLVTYKAPIFDFIFNPEIDVLRSLTYLKLCLYEDAKKEVDSFYRNFLDPATKLRNYILSKGKNYLFFYQLVTTFEDSKMADDFLMSHLLQSLTKDGAYTEMKSGLLESILEFKKVKAMRNSKFKSLLISDLKEVIGMYRKLIGSYTRNHLVKGYADLFRAFKSMSYIKLEVLAQKKEALYRDNGQNRTRGDIKYIQRNDKQYFWNFNGEFWADELGDYVFALGSEC